MCIEKKNNRFIHHNEYFIAWLTVVKNVDIENTKNNKGYFIIGLTKEAYEECKQEYKKYKNVLSKINNKVNKLKRI